MPHHSWRPVALPFAHLNLRINPFGELPREERGRAACVPELDCPPGSVIQVLGAAGRGKSTHLLGWHTQHPGSLYEYVGEGADTLVCRTLPALCFIDEAQRLRRAELARLFERAERLVISSHDDLSRQTTRPLRTLVLRGVTPARLERMLARRVELARPGPGAVPRFPPETVHALLDRFGDDLRELESHLYDIFQYLEHPGDVRL
jgi:hypothetical protein